MINLKPKHNYIHIKYFLCQRSRTFTSWNLQTESSSTSKTTVNFDTLKTYHYFCCTFNELPRYAMNRSHTYGFFPTILFQTFFKLTIVFVFHCF